MNMSDRTWDHYSLLEDGDFDAFWASYLQESDGRICYVLATGFDPRAHSCLSRITKLLSASAEFSALLLHLDYEESDSGMRSRADENTEEIRSCIGSWGPHEEKTVQVAVADQPGAGAGNARLLARQWFQSQKPKHIVIDMNAMPKSVALSIIEMALRYNRDVGKGAVNVHVVVTHDPGLDEAIRNVEVSADAFPLPGMLSDVLEEGQDDIARIWIPILGKGSQSQMRAIHESVQPHEICPAVPSPSNNPRIADELIVEHQEFLQEGDRLVPENVLRISEDNPFEAYHEILETIREYATTYANLGGCVVYLSCHASKLLSLAVLLAAEDSRRRGICKRVTIEFVEARAHRMADTEKPPGVPHTMWLAGEPFLIKERREKA